MRFMYLTFAIVLYAAWPKISFADASWPLWYTVESADVIAYGKLSVQTMGEGQGKSNESKLSVEIQIAEIVKGKVNAKLLPFTYQMFDGLEKPLENQLRMLNKKDVMVVLKYIPSSGEYVIPIELGASAVIPATESTVADITGLIAKEKFSQARLSKLIESRSTEDQIVAAIDKLSSRFEFRRNEGRDELIEAGCAGVPYIIMHMRDYRSYRGNLELNNKAVNSFEAFRSYNPKVIYDALSAILTQITGLVFENVENGGTNDEREKDYQGWLTYLSFDLGAYGDDTAAFVCK